PGGRYHAHEHGGLVAVLALDLERVTTLALDAIGAGGQRGAVHHERKRNLHLLDPSPGLAASEYKNRGCQYRRVASDRFHDPPPMARPTAPRWRLPPVGIGRGGPEGEVNGGLIRIHAL